MSAEALREVYGLVDALTESEPESWYDEPTGCAEFSVKDLLFHLLLDAQRALVALADPVGVPPDTDSVSYWRKYVAGIADGDDDAHAGYVQRSALAYGTPSSLGRHWRDVSHAAVAAARRADPEATVATQDHLIAVDDFVKTLVVEAAVHYWDLTVERDDRAGIPAAVMRIVRETMAGLLGRDIPPDWSDAMLLTKPTGRAALGEADLAELGEAAKLIPVIR